MDDKIAAAKIRVARRARARREAAERVAVMDPTDRAIIEQQFTHARAVEADRQAARRVRY